MHLLVLDDEERIASFIVAVAEGIGWTAEAALDETVFQASFRRTMPDLIMLDLQLGSSDGVEQLRYLHREDYRGDVRARERLRPARSRRRRAARHLARAYCLGRPAKARARLGGAGVPAPRGAQRAPGRERAGARGDCRGARGTTFPGRRWARARRRRDGTLPAAGRHLGHGRRHQVRGPDQVAPSGVRHAAARTLRSARRARRRRDRRADDVGGARGDFPSKPFRQRPFGAAHRDQRFERQLAPARFPGSRCNARRRERLAVSLRSPSR